MTKYGWRRIAEEQGWTVIVDQSEDGWWRGTLLNKDVFIGGWGRTEIETLNALEAWWRDQVTA